VRLLRNFSVVFLVAGISAQEVQAQAPISLRWTPEVGREEVRRTEIVITVAGVNMPMSGVFMTQNLYSTDVVLESDGEVTMIRSVIDSMDMEMPMMGGLPPGTPSLEGMTVTMALSSRGEVSQVKMGEDTPSGAEMFASQISEGFANAYTVFPEEEVAVGESWQVTVDVPSSAAAALPPEARTIDFTFRVESIDSQAGVVSISISGSIGSDSEGSPLSGTVSGMMEFDYVNSSLKNSEQEMEMKMTDPNIGLMEMTVTTQMTLLSNTGG